jgi:hypothetical protein
MTHFAKIKNNLVTEVIVAEQDFIDTLSGEWIQTSYNTYAGKHPEERPLRKNYAGEGFSYDRTRNAFVPPKTFPSWVIDEDTCLWKAPVDYPSDTTDLYGWDEDAGDWVLIEDSRPMGDS